MKTKYLLLLMVMVCGAVAISYALWEDVKIYKELYLEGEDALKDARRLEKIHPESARIEYELAVDLLKKSVNAYPNSLVADKAEFLLGEAYESLAQMDKDRIKKVELLGKSFTQYQRVYEYFPASELRTEAKDKKGKLEESIKLERHLQ